MVLQEDDKQFVNFIFKLDQNLFFFSLKILSNGTSVLDVRAKVITGNKLSKNKRRRQRRDTLPNTKPVKYLFFSSLISSY